MNPQKEEQMSAPAVTANEAVQPTTGEESTPKLKRDVYVSLRIKLVVIFVTLFTVVFLAIALWVLQFSAQSAQDRLAQQLIGQVEGAAQTVDGDAFAELVTTAPAVLDPSEESGFGYPDNPAYAEVARGLFDAFQVTGSGTYTWFKDPQDGQLYTAASSGYYREPQTGYRYKIPLDQVAEPATYALMEQGLSVTTEEPAYTDAYGSWMGVYSPILNSSGVSVGGIGQDISLEYVSEVRAKAVQQVLPVLLGMYVILVLLVWLLASRIVKPIRRLTVESSRIADGDYERDLDSLSTSRLQDEISTLASTFAVMAAKVAQRERSLQVEVKRLRVEIDSTKRAESVKAITDSEGFAEIAQRAAEMRKRMNEPRD
jgi:HAMP domain-containing protein